MQLLHNELPRRTAQYN